MPRGFLARLTGRSDREMPFLEHLEELRHVILASLGALAVCTIAGWFVSGWLLDYIVVKSVGQAQFLHPLEALNVRFKISMILGAMAALPFISFQLWSFILPGLYRHERRVVLPLVIASTALFYAGVAFSYWVLTPLLLRLLGTFATPHVRPNITIDYLLDFMLKMALASGIAFEVPVVVVILTLLHIVTPRLLWSRWREAIVIIVTISAIATPGDAVVSTLVLCIPVLFLYFGAAIVSSILYRKQKRKDAERDREFNPPGGPGTGSGSGGDLAG